MDYLRENVEKFNRKVQKGQEKQFIKISASD
jgi:hypothetical protein